MVGKQRRWGKKKKKVGNQKQQQRQQKRRHITATQTKQSSAKHLHPTALHCPTNTSTITSAHRTSRSAESSSPTMSNCTLPSCAAPSPSPLPVRTRSRPAARTPASRRSPTLRSIARPNRTRNRGTRLQIHRAAQRQHVFAPQVSRHPEQLLLLLVEHHLPRGSRQVRARRARREHDFHGYPLRHHGVPLGFPRFPRFGGLGAERDLEGAPDAVLPAGPGEARAAVEVEGGVVGAADGVGGELDGRGGAGRPRRPRRAGRTGASGRSGGARGRRSGARAAPRSPPRSAASAPLPGSARGGSPRAARRTRSTPSARPSCAFTSGEIEGIRGDGRVQVLDDADADLVAQVGEVRAAPAHRVVRAAGQPGVFGVEVLRVKRDKRRESTATLFTSADTLFITVGMGMMDDMIDGSVITGMPKSATSSRS